MGELSRRAFLGRGSLTVAAATVLASVPATAVSAIAARAGDPAATEDEVTEVGGEIEGALVAHVRDLTTGEISVFNGTREFVVRDPSLAGRLARAAR